MTRTGEDAAPDEPYRRAVRRNASRTMPQRLGLAPAALARGRKPARHARRCASLVTDRAAARARVFAPIHWTDQLASRARIDALIAAHVDPVSGPAGTESHAGRGRSRSRRAGTALRSVARSARGQRLDYWALAPASRRLAPRTRRARAPTRRIGHVLRAPCCRRRRDGRRRSPITIAASGQHPLRRVRRRPAVGALFVAREPVAVSRAWARRAARRAVRRRRRPLRAARRARRRSGSRDKGAIVCACFEVGRNQIAAAIARRLPHASQRSALRRRPAPTAAPAAPKSGG